jgi:hypothetical protein
VYVCDDEVMDGLHSSCSSSSKNIYFSIAAAQHRMQLIIRPISCRECSVRQ